MSDSVRQQLGLLLTGYGYNLYDDKNRARADDLLVREKAAGALGEAAGAIGSLRTAYRRRFVPPPTREQPSPPPERMAALRDMATLQNRLADLETRIRSMPVPTQDRIWERFRHERSLLNQLLVNDYNLIAPCQQAREAAQALTPDSWSVEAAAAIEGIAGQVEKAIRGRGEFLAAPG